VADASTHREAFSVVQVIVADPPAATVAVDAVIVAVGLPRSSGDANAATHKREAAIKPNKSRFIEISPKEKIVIGKKATRPH
jgi:hypothetical protein